MKRINIKFEIQKIKNFTIYQTRFIKSNYIEALVNSHIIEYPKQKANIIQLAHKKTNFFILIYQCGKICRFTTCSGSLTGNIYCVIYFFNQNDLNTILYFIYYWSNYKKYYMPGNIILLSSKRLKTFIISESKRFNISFFEDLHALNCFNKAQQFY
jgi:hypothetical protein